LRLRDPYDVPEDVAAGPHSPAFEKFLWNWFGDTRALTHGELDLTFLDELTPEELSLARKLIRRNLRLNYTHIVEGASALHDVDAVPILREMLRGEPNMSRRLTISGALWKISRDPAFVECLLAARAGSARKPDAAGKIPWRGPHLLQVLWLEDERAVDFLISLLDVKDELAQRAVLRLLNELEFGPPMGVPPMPHTRAHYRRLRIDPAFRAQMVAAIRERNAKSKNGW
jgi:hypothetical protein